MFRIFFFICTLLALPGFAQDTDDAIVEIQIDDAYRMHEPFEFGDSGIIIQSQKRSKQKGKIEYKYEKFDTQLKSIQTETLLVDKSLSSTMSTFSEEELHTIFLSRKGEFTLLSLNQDKLAPTKVDGLLPKNTWLLDMVVLGDFLYCSVTIKKKHHLCVIHWKTGDARVLPIQIAGYSDLRRLKLQIIESSHEVISFYRSIRNNNQTVVHAVILSDNGNKQQVYNLSEKIKKNIVTISAAKTEKGKYIFNGSYAEESTNSSDGIFAYVWSNGKPEKFEYIHYLDLNLFTSYFDEFKQKYIALKKKTKEKNGEVFSLNYKLIEHDLIPIEDGYIFLAEAYFKVYEENLTTSRAYIAEDGSDPNILYKGNQYTHVIICRINKMGKIMWNTSLKLNPSYNPKSSKKFVSLIDIHKYAFDIGYFNQEKLETYSINFDGEVLFDKSFEYPNYAKESKHWFGDFFISYQVGHNQSQRKKSPAFKITKLKF